ncbi:MAG: NUDIX hydrolase [bacterium]
MDLQVGVKIILQNKEGKILLLHRNWDKYPEVKKDNSWDIVGGRIEKGTPLLENLKREIFEETKLNLVEEPKLLAAQDILRADKHVVRLTYLGKIDGEPTLDQDHDAYKWVTLEEIKNEHGLDQYFKEVFSKLDLK